MELTFDLDSGRISGERWGDLGAPLVVAVHGLSANHTAYSWLAEALVRVGRQVVAIDCRGRGRSEVTAVGSYGMASHARDVVEIAQSLGAEQFDYLGWSMGAAIGMQVAGDAPAAVRSLVMIDLVGPVDPGPGEMVNAGLQRLDAVVGRPQEYVDLIRARRIIDPWTPFWTAHYRYELAERPDGQWAPTTSKAACLEDMRGLQVDWPGVWAGLGAPTTLVRTTTPIGGNLLVSEQARDDFHAACPDVKIVETETNHYTVMTDPVLLAATVERLGMADRAEEPA